MNRAVKAGVVLAAAIGGSLCFRALRPEALPASPDTAASVATEPARSARVVPQRSEPDALRPPVPDVTVERAADTTREGRAQVTPEERMKRFFGEAAKLVAARWQDEPIGDHAERAEQRVEQAFERVAVEALMRDVECRTSLCRVRMDWGTVERDVEANRRMAGALGADGWLLHEGDALVAFIPSDFEPLREL